MSDMVYIPDISETQVFAMNMSIHGPSAPRIHILRLASRNKAVVRTPEQKDLLSPDPLLFIDRRHAVVKMRAPSPLVHFPLLTVKTGWHRRLRCMQRPQRSFLLWTLFFAGHKDSFNIFTILFSLSLSLLATTTLLPP